MKFFEVSLYSLNLLSFMLGMAFACVQHWGSNTPVKYVVAYFILLACYYGVKVNFPNIL
jgi:hypothetical protein